MGACLALALSAAWTCAAAQPAVLVVRAEPELEGLADALGEAIREGALDDGHTYGAPPASASSPSDEGWLARATLEAEDHFAAFELERASQALDEALLRVDREGTAGTNRGELIELLLLGARIAQARGDEGSARMAAQRALVLSPELVVDAARHPPTLTALVEAERASLTACPLALRPTPGDARIAIDGLWTRTIPTSLPCGAHWISASAPGYRDANTQVELEPEGAVIELALAIDPGAALALHSEPEAPASPLSRAAALLLDRELVYLDVIRAGEVLRVTLGASRVEAPASAGPEEIVSLLRGAARAGSFDVGLAVGVGTGIAVALAALITTLAIVLQPGPPTDFELRGQILP